MAKNYSLEDVEQGNGLFLFGTTGTGKTHLSIAVVRNLLIKNTEKWGVRENDRNMIFDARQEEYKGLCCSFFSTVELLDALKPGNEARQEKGEWLFHRAKIDDLVILDDIGAEYATPWAENRIYALINSRNSMKRATIFTSNYKEKEMIKNLGERVVSRIYEMSEQVPVIGPDYRRKR